MAPTAYSDLNEKPLSWGFFVPVFQAILYGICYSD